jgi:hypothetical protein
MALAKDLLQIADELRGGSREADLRRSASSSYYSAFHLLVSHSLDLVVSPQIPLSLYVRSIQHSELMKCAQAFEKPNNLLTSYGFAGTVSDDLKLVAENIQKLYGWRIDADYDSVKGFASIQANDAYSAAVDLHDAANRLRSSQESGYVCMLAGTLIRKPVMK